MSNHAFHPCAAALLALSAVSGAVPAAAQRSGLDGGGSAVSTGAGRIAALPRNALRFVTGTLPRGNMHLPAEPNLLGTVAVRAGTTPVSARWTRASTAGAADPVLAAIVEHAASMRRHQRAAFVQSAINRAIDRRHDHSRWNADSYWATPQETMRGGTADCEDIAVAKMQALRRLGFEPRDLYLIVGMIAGGGQHAALMVRIDGRFWVLDDRDDRMVEARAFSAFAPVMTFGAGMTWIHGRRVAPAGSPAAAPVVAATLAAVDGE